MWRTAALIVGLAGLLAGCSFDGSSGHSSAPGYLEGRVLTRACGGLASGGSCKPIPYQGEIVLCRKRDQLGPCPAARVNLAGRYRIKLPPGRYYLVSAPGKGNVVDVMPRWVVVTGGQTRTMNISGGNEMKSLQRLDAQGGYFDVSYRVSVAGGHRWIGSGRLTCPTGDVGMPLPVVDACQKIRARPSSYVGRAMSLVDAKPLVGRIQICGNWNGVGIFDDYRPQDAPQFSAWYKLLVGGTPRTRLDLAGPPMRSCLYQ